MDTAPLLQQVVRHHFLFSGLSAQQQDRILEHCSLVRVGGGEMLFNRGDPARHFYVVIQGKMELCLISPMGDKKILDVIGPGKAFGEAIVFHRQKNFPVCALGMEPTELCRIESETYLSVLSQDVNACLVLLGSVCRRLHSQVLEIEDLSITNATHRLVRYLLEHLQPTGEDRGRIDLDLPRQDIAARLSVKPETLSRLLRRLVDEKVLAVNGRRLEVISLEQLRRFE